MVKKIIACSDIHIHNVRRLSEAKEMLTRFIEECKRIASEYEKDEIRIVIAGDILHNKLDISGEGYITTAWFLRQLDEIAPTIVIAGNHDLNMRNLTRLDPLSAIFGMCKFQQVHYLDRDLGYASGCVQDDNIVWCLYSCFDGYAAPPELEDPTKRINATYVGLFHGQLKGSRNSDGFVFESGISPSYFEGVDFGILGHIHKRQCLTHNGIPLVYCSSLIQQDHGETVSGHGYTLWDVEERTYEEIDIPNETYGFYTIGISSIDDLDANTEEITNL